MKTLHVLLVFSIFSVKTDPAYSMGTNCLFFSGYLPCLLRGKSSYFGSIVSLKGFAGMFASSVVKPLLPVRQNQVSGLLGLTSKLRNEELAAVAIDIITSVCCSNVGVRLTRIECRWSEFTLSAPHVD
jgi:hypothetical protein